MANYYFELKRAANSQVYFRFRAPNHETVVVSETYTTKAAAQSAINLLRTQAASATIVDSTS